MEKVLSGQRILLAEDNATNQLVAAEMIRTLGGEVVLAADGREALAHFENARFDLGLIDIEMPRLSGLDVIRTVRAFQGARANTPLIALTAYVMDEHRQRIMQAGANGIIAKPLVSVRAFADYIRAHLSNPATVQPQQTHSHVNMDVIEDAVFGELLKLLGAEAMQTLTIKVLEDFAEARTGIVPGSDTVVLRAKSHMLMSVSGTIGAHALQTAARKLNEIANTRSALPSQLDAASALVLSELDRVEAYLRAHRSGRS